MPARERLALLLASAFFLAACSKEPGRKAADAPHEHGHEKAPHGGEVVELGGEEDYHLEFIHDHTGGNVTVYVLDKDLKTPIATPAPTIVISTKEGSKEFTLTAVSPAADGTSDAWKGSHPGLVSDPWNGRIRVRIRGKDFQGPLEPN
jgi:hypothetical protein